MVLMFSLTALLDNFFWPCPSAYFFYTLIGQFIFALASISSIGAYFVRLIYGSRNLCTREERDRLQPLFDEVYDEVKKQNPHISKNIKLYIDDDITINAYAINQTITITKGAMMSLTDEEIKGVFSHEFGHIRNGDTSLTAFMILGNTAFLFVFLAIKIVHFVFWIISAVTDDNFMLSKLFGGVTNLAMGLFMFLLNLILLLNSRISEFQADKFAYDIGYGEEILASLYLLDKYEINQKLTVLERLKSSHPHLKDRIGRLETMIDQENTSDMALV